MIFALTIIIVLMVLYLLALRGRTKHPLLRSLRKWKYAHRGLHGNGVPENSLAAFQKALESGYGSELDIHLLADGNLAVIHDASLLRTAGVDVKIESLSTDDLQNYRLEGTDEKIPTFQEVLDLYAGKAPLIVELKPEDGNFAQLSETACAVLANYQGLYCLESFDPRCIRWLKSNRPNLVRGQLSYNSFADKKCKVAWPLRLCMTSLLTNFWNRPDFIAFNFSERKNLSVYISRKLWKIQGVAWTLRNDDDYQAAAAEDWIPIFENFEP